MRRLACALLLSGCAMHASLSPPSLTTVLFYGRATDCPGQPIPPQLTPQEETSRDFSPAPPPCRTLEVGAKSYADLVGAIGAALVSLLMFL